MNKKDITLTPLELVRSVGEFDLDPCGFEGHKTANEIYLLPLNDGLKDSWKGKVWLNPPYSETEKWIKIMANHNNGVACVLASTETNWFQEYVLKKANGIFFLKSRPKFLNDNLEVVNLMRGVVLVSYGDCYDYLKECKLEGVFVGLNDALVENHEDNSQRGKTAMETGHIALDVQPRVSCGEKQSTSISESRLSGVPDNPSDVKPEQDALSDEQEIKKEIDKDYALDKQGENDN